MEMDKQLNLLFSEEHQLFKTEEKMQGRSPITVYGFGYIGTNTKEHLEEFTSSLKLPMTFDDVMLAYLERLYESL